MQQKFIVYMSMQVMVLKSMCGVVPSTCRQVTLFRLQLSERICPMVA